MGNDCFQTIDNRQLSTVLFERTETNKVMSGIAPACCLQAISVSQYKDEEPKQSTVILLIRRDSSQNSWS